MQTNCTFSPLPLINLCPVCKRKVYPFKSEIEIIFYSLDFEHNVNKSICILKTINLKIHWNNFYMIIIVTWEQFLYYFTIETILIILIENMFSRKSAFNKDMYMRTSYIDGEIVLRIYVIAGGWKVQNTHFQVCVPEARNNNNDIKLLYFTWRNLLSLCMQVQWNI